MPNIIQYHTSKIDNSLGIGNMRISSGPVDAGPTGVTGFYNGVNPPHGGYTIYQHKASGGPSILCPTSDAELIVITNQIAGTSYTTINECFNYFAGQDDKTVMHNPINYLVTDGLVFYVNAGVIPSYPHNNNTWYDLSGESNNTTISSANYNSGGGYFQSVGDAPDSLIFATPDSTTISGTFSVVDGGWTIEELIRIDDTTYPEAAAGTAVSGRAYGSNETGFDWNHGVMSGTSLNIDMSNKNTGGGASRDAEVNLAIDSDLQTYGQWILRSIYWDRTNDKCGVYYNGRFQDSGSISGVSGFPLYDGGGISWGTLYGWHHDGARSFMRVYNRVLSESEVKQNYYQAPIVTDGLVLAVDAGNLVSYESGSTTTNSLTGSDSGTLTNGVGFNGSNGGIWEFDGIDDYIAIDNLGLSSNTIEGWFNSDDATQGGAGYATICSIFGNYDGGSSKYTYIGLIPNLTFRIDDGVSSHRNVATVSYSANTWYHVALTYDATSGVATAYVNGESIGNITYTTNITFNSIPHNIAKTQVNVHFDGEVALHRTYDRALTAGEVENNYKANVNKFN